MKDEIVELSSLQSNLYRSVREPHSLLNTPQYPPLNAHYPPPSFTGSSVDEDFMTSSSDLQRLILDSGYHDVTDASKCQRSEFISVDKLRYVLNKKIKHQPLLDDVRSDHIDTVHYYYSMINQIAYCSIYL